MINFQLFRRFTQQLEIDEVSGILQSKNIPFKIASPDSPLGSSFGSLNQEFFELYLRNEDFESAEQILKKRAEEIVQNIKSDYYLFTFSDSELQNILSNPDDWNELDVLLSAKILNDRKSNSTKKDFKPDISGNEHTKKPNSFRIKDSLEDHLKYYAVLVITTLIGVISTLYVKAYHPEITNTHIAIAIAVLIIIIVFYYDNKYPCPKCKEKFNTERLHRLEQGDIAMPHPYNILERFKCHNCGHVWNEFSEERLGD
jgi:transposase-like protein